jgi:hypothetical protein
MATALCKLQLELKCSSSIDDFQSRTPPIREHNIKGICANCPIVLFFFFFSEGSLIILLVKSEQLAFSVF